MSQAKRERGRGPSGPGRGSVFPLIGRNQQPEPVGWILRDEAGVDSDDSTQPPDELHPSFLPPFIPAEVNTTCNNQDDVCGDHIEPNTSKRGRGVAKGTEFERIRKYGKIPLEIKEGKIGPSCNNRTVYTTRVTWIVKHYADMRHVSWNVVDEKEKQELIDRVRADFVLDWTLKNHRRTVMSQLSRAYNAFHYKLHKKYLSYATHEEAAKANVGGSVEQTVWEWLCNRWGSDSFKKMSRQNKENRAKQMVNHTSGRTSFVVLMERKKDKNMIDFYKDVHWSNKKGRFITPTTEDNYNQMVEKMNAKEPDTRTDEAAANIFREVLGHRPGYSRGMGHSVMPESPKVPGIQK
ncbi:uncharacterized protein LOC122297630 [Carya illinoinensis]|uniref:uncharacterized protein LOC122297630 n=1 Tax=Carya illinoinensis TaxID=32201 RepID=UPI001C7256D8|nr:uncharacterized protein LOC122297630 [Carya illinoinensis]